MEKVIADLNPQERRIDPATRFWTVYKEIADEHNNDLFNKYAGDLDTSLLFVSIFTSFARLVPPQPRSFSVLGGFVLCRRYNFHCPNNSVAPTKPFRPHERSTASNITTKRFIRWFRPAGTRRECFLQGCPSSVDLICQFGSHLTCGLRRGIGETMGRVLHTSLDVGEHRRSREGTPSEVRGASEVETTLHHGVTTRFVAVCAPPFWHRPQCLPLGSRPFRRNHRGWVHVFWYCVLRVYHRRCNYLDRLSVPDTLIDFTSEGVAVQEGIPRARLCLAVAKGQRTPAPYPMLPDKILQMRFGGVHRSSRHAMLHRRPLYDALEPRILEGRSNF